MPEGSRLTNTTTFRDRFLTEANWDKIERLSDFCSARGRSMLELAFSWLATRPAVASVMAGATRPEQVEANVKAVNWELSAEEMAEVDRITGPASPASNGS
jgi:aryl-alcohol dehydrogenase-like predicted oxidoreductase